MTASSAIAADALDALGYRDYAMDSHIAPVATSMRVVGRAYPVEVVSDPALPEHPYQGEMDALASMSAHDVGVYGVAKDAVAAAWGELFSCAAIGRGVSGVVVDGPIRDTRQIEDLEFPVFAADRSPLDTLARARVTSHGTNVSCGGVSVSRGDVVVGDRDGIVVIPGNAAAEVAAFIATKQRLEAGARADLLAGMSIQDVWTKYGVF